MPPSATSLEAACGKNPISHVGKVYNLLALLTAQDIVDQVPEVKEVTVYLLSQIGAPLDQPLIATAQVRPVNGVLTPTIQEEVQAVIDERLENVNDLRVCILSCEQALF